MNYSAILHELSFYFDTQDYLAGLISDFQSAVNIPNDPDKPWAIQNPTHSSVNNAPEAMYQKVAGGKIAEHRIIRNRLKQLSQLHLTTLCQCFRDLPIELKRTFGNVAGLVQFSELAQTQEYPLLYCRTVANDCSDRNNTNSKAQALAVSKVLAAQAWAILEPALEAYQELGSHESTPAPETRLKGNLERKKHHKHSKPDWERIAKSIILYKQGLAPLPKKP